METAADVRAGSAETKVIPPKFRIHMGWDPREDLAYDVARHSILRRTDPKRVLVIPLKLPHLQKWLGDRPIERREDGKLFCPISQAPMATEFAISRFVIPHLQSKGWALFVDCDIVCLADVRELFALADDKYAVMVVKHNQVGGPDTKMDGISQTYYARKNWSSIVLWRTDHPSHKKLTLEALCKWPGRDLHAFKWLEDSEIGELPPEWNHLVDVTPAGIFTGRSEPTKIAHFTLGGPWLKDWKGGSWDQVWLDELEHMRPSKPKAA